MERGGRRGGERGGGVNVMVLARTSLFAYQANINAPNSRTRCSNVL